MFAPGFVVTNCHAKPLLAVPKAQKASSIVRTSGNARKSESVAMTETAHHIANTAFLSGDETSKTFILS